MKILHVHDRLGGYGGGEVYLSEVVAGQRQAGLDVSVLLVVAEPPSTPAPDGTYYLRKPLGYRRGRAELPQLLALLKQQAPDVVHLHCVFSPVWLKQIIKRYPTILTVHSVEILCFLSSKIRADNHQICTRAMGWSCITSGCYQPLQYGGWRYGFYQAWLRWRLLRMLPALTRLIAPSRSMANELITIGVDPKRIATVPHFSRVQLAAPPEHRDLRHLLFVGRLSWEKGVLELISTAEHLQTPDWQLTIVGDGPLRSVLEQRIHDSGLADRVRLTGQLDRQQLGDYYRKASVLVVPSQVPEAFGLAGIEAMACACPVVGFDIGGIADWLQHEQTGYLLAANDQSGMVRRLDELLAAPQRARQLGLQAWQAANQRFSLSTHLQQLDHVYLEARRDYEFAHRH